MSGNAIFNATVCLIGIGILLIHIFNLLIKKGRRKDENNLFVFLIFTAIHFAVYLTFTLIKVKYTSDTFIISFYTTFYIFNILKFSYQKSKEVFAYLVDRERSHININEIMP